jgi:CubicO group peptidase (beta-lactamase class C family)
VPPAGPRTVERLGYLAYGREPAASFRYGWPVTEADTLRGAALLQRGAEDLVAVACGTTGTDPDASCSLQTRFQIASVTKQFTAAAVLLLADRGVLSVNDPVSRWLDGCPAAWDPITVHHLLSHSSGLVHWPGLHGLEVTRPVTTSEKLRVFAAAALLSPPGQRYSYSSPGYVLLAHILERATGSSTTPATTPATARSTPGFPMTACAWSCSATKAPPTSTRSSMT